MTTTDYRLPKTVLPLAYAVDLDTSPKRDGFHGTLTLRAKAIATVRRIELHARDLTVTNARVRAGKREHGCEVVPHLEHETIALELGTAIEKGPLTITLDFAGKLNPSMHGLYLAVDGTDRSIASQCEATDARAIFPCFDEPEFKATFEWTIRTDPGLVVITNGVPAGKRKTKTRPVREVHRFKPTRVMSSYLCAVTVGNYEAKRPKTIVRAPCRIWCVKGKLDQTDFAQEVTAQVLPWYEKYFGQKYNYQKLDQVAVAGFDAGAMENVGAILYRQNLLLMKPGATSFGAIKRIAEVVAHELAHQWFGNLVTMAWWDDLWLNEAFATWIAYKAVDAWKPEWRMWDDYLEHKESALAADALVNTHPVYTPVKTPAEATELFDVITYEKGCAVLRMLESYLGAKTFEKGIKAYQAKFKNRNAAGADLWTALEKASREPVRALMGSWVSQSGFPLLNVTTREVDGKTVVRIAQRRFFANAREMQLDHDQRWTIPIVLRYDEGNGPETHRVLLTEHEQDFALPDDARALWVYPNQDGTGFYRMHLDDPTLEAVLQRGLPYLTAAERMGLLEDQWALVRNGLSDVETFMDVLSAMRGDDDHIVTRTMAGRLAFLDNFLVRDSDKPLLQKYTQWLFGGAVEQLGYEPLADETPGQAVRRAAVVATLGEVGRDPQVLAEARRRAQREMKDPLSVEPNLAGTLLSLAALEGDDAALDRYLAIYAKRTRQKAAPELQLRYIGALASFERPAVAKRVLALCLDGTVPQEQLRTVLSPLLSRRSTQRATWAFLKEHWATLAPRVGSMGIARLVEAMGALPPELSRDVEEFFAAHPVEEAKRALQKALEAMALRAELVSREQARLSDWLQRTGERRMAVGA